MTTIRLFDDVDLTLSLTQLPDNMWFARGDVFQGGNSTGLQVTGMGTTLDRAVESARLEALTKFRAGGTAVVND